MGRNLGVRERKSPIKAASNRALAKRPRKSVPRVTGSRRDTRGRAQAAIARIQDLWPYCEQLARQVIMNDLRDAHGRPLMEPVRDYQGKVVGKRRVRVPIALSMSTAQDLWDRTGFSRETTQKITGELATPGVMVQLVGYPKPNAAEAPALANGHGEPAGNGAAPESAH